VEGPDSRFGQLCTIYCIRAEFRKSSRRKSLRRKVERKRVELSTSALRTCEHSDASDSSKALTSTPSDACTCACTSEGENDNAGTPDQGDLLAKLAAVIANLSLADRERLATMITVDAARTHR
jgi:hypothetical protein